MKIVSIITISALLLGVTGCSTTELIPPISAFTHNGKTHYVYSKEYVARDHTYKPKTKFPQNGVCTKRGFFDNHIFLLTSLSEEYNLEKSNAGEFLHETKGVTLITRNLDIALHYGYPISLIKSVNEKFIENVRKMNYCKTSKVDDIIDDVVRSKRILNRIKTGEAKIILSKINAILNEENRSKLAKIENDKARAKERKNIIWRKDSNIN